MREGMLWSSWMGTPSASKIMVQPIGGGHFLPKVLRVALKLTWYHDTKFKSMPEKIGVKERDGILVGNRKRSWSCRKHGEPNIL